LLGWAGKEGVLEKGFNLFIKGTNN
jgi:hypothetical protein